MSRSRPNGASVSGTDGSKRLRNDPRVEVLACDMRGKDEPVAIRIILSEE